MMERSDIVKHYSLIAENYDQMCSFTYEDMSSSAVKYLDLKDSDILVDIGAGTGTISHLVWKRAGLASPVVCVEPSGMMIKQIIKKEGLKPYQGVADTFFKNYNGPRCNKVLINGCAHLFPDPQFTFNSVAEYLHADGLLVLVIRAEKCSLPLWKSLKETFAPVKVDTYKSFLKNAGFEVTTYVEMYKYKMTKGEWCDKIRKRVLDVLAAVADHEIEEGLGELNKEWFPDKDDCDAVDIFDEVIYLCARIKN